MPNQGAILIILTAMTKLPEASKMDPTYMEWMSTQVQKGGSVTTNGSHISQYDDAEGYFSGLIKFIKDVDQGDFNWYECKTGMEEESNSIPNSNRKK